MNPYSGLPDRQFWRRAVATVPRHDVDPVGAPRFKISRQDRIATAGSCFAQHLSAQLAARGFNFFVPESDPTLPAPEARRRHFGMFSARYGNIYSTRQLLQLFEEAFGERQPVDRSWRRPDGRFVDPFRPLVEPDGFSSPDEVAASREKHLRCVRALFEQADLFIFTLGLTECWIAASDGSTFPLAPGVAAGAFDPQAHRFLNLSAHEVAADLRRFVEKLKTVNAGIKILLTVSPVPLIATYEPQDVLVATTCSKAALRVAADEVWRACDWVDYFPSYEIVTGLHAGNAYFDDDLRTVSPRGVAHVMRCFAAHYLEGADASVPLATVPDDQRAAVICDEETIALVRI